MSWRFLLPHQRRTIQLHRKVFLCAWPGRPRWQWLLIALYSAVTWLVYFGWRQVFLVIKHRSQRVSEKFYVPVWKQLLDLLSLAFLHGIPPCFYYQYRLFHTPHKKWLDYIYSHELPHWHQVLSGKVSHNTILLMTEKRAFAEYMAKQGLAAVTTYAFFSHGTQLKPDDIFQEQSFFFKPDIGSRAEGCLLLSFDEKTGIYQLDTGETIETGDKILADVNRRVLQQAYLLQPLLRNHQHIAELCCTSRLVTLRLVTGIIEEQPTALFAQLEIYCPVDQKDSWLLLGLDLATGQLYKSNEYEHEAHQKTGQQLHGKTLPFWQEAMAICLEAHQYFPDLPTIGWDVVFTPTGVKLLEGNINWGIVGHQWLSDQPLLNTQLVEAYS